MSLWPSFFWPSLYTYGILLVDKCTFHNNVVFLTHSEITSLLESLKKKQGQNINLSVAGFRAHIKIASRIVAAVRERESLNTRLPTELFTLHELTER